MASDLSEARAVAADSPTDSGLRCPQCEYNLTGLTLPRCPECGAPFDWEEVRRAAAARPTIAFERARGWRNVPAFFVTWATVLFVPWVFARQVVQRVSWRHGLIFGGACLAGTSLSYVSGMDSDFHATWLLTALAYIPLQVLWLSMLDPAAWREPLKTLRFWLLASCYTSAVMVTESVHGPPPVFAEDLWDLVTTGTAGGWFSELYSLSTRAAVCWGQMVLWLVALGCIYARRVAERRAARYVPVRAGVVCFSLLVLYSAVLQWVGEPIAGWF